jgi:toxin ParE1/3/4
MPSFKVARQATRDLVEIYNYGAERFGQAQADAYHIDLESCFQRLSEHPKMGRERTAGGNHVRIFFHHSHVVVYQETGLGINVVRVLSGRQDWRHILGDI